MKNLIPGILLALGILLIAPGHAAGQDPLTPEELLKLQSVSAIQISPDKKEMIYSVSVPRGPNDKPGGAKRQYMRTSMAHHLPSPLFEKLENASSPAYSKDGKYIGFLFAEKGQPKQVWMMNTTGGNLKKLTNEPSGVTQFKWQPGNRGVGPFGREPSRRILSRASADSSASPTT